MPCLILAGLSLHLLPVPPLSFSFRQHSCGGAGMMLGRGREGWKEEWQMKTRADLGAGIWTGTDGGGEALPPDLSFGDDVIHDHIDHGARSKGQSVRQDRLGQNHGEGPKEAGQRLHHAAQLPVPRERTEMGTTWESPAGPLHAHTADPGKGRVYPTSCRVRQKQRLLECGW